MEAEIISRETKPVSFAPHWFIMIRMIMRGIASLAVILLPLFFG
jgi:hypothetical protein